MLKNDPLDSATITESEVKAVIPSSRLEDALHIRHNLIIVFYKIYLREGAYDELLILDWFPLNRGVCENWFILDTSWMIPQTYFIDFKVVNKQTIKTYTDKIKINVIDKPIFH